MSSLKRKHPQNCTECELCNLSPRIKKIKLSDKNTQLQKINYNPLSLSKKLFQELAPTTIIKDSHIDINPSSLSKKLFEELAPTTIIKDSHIDINPLSLSKKLFEELAPTTTIKDSHIDINPLSLSKLLDEPPTIVIRDSHLATGNSSLSISGIPNDRTEFRIAALEKNYVELYDKLTTLECTVTALNRKLCYLGSELDKTTENILEQIDGLNEKLKHIKKIPPVKDSDHMPYIK